MPALNFLDPAFLAKIVAVDEGGGGELTLPVTSGLVLYVDIKDAATLWANSIRTTPATLNGSVAGITDKSGSNNHLSSSGTTPTWVEDSNGKNVIRMVGGTSQFLFTSGINTVRTMFLVLREATGAPANYVFLMGQAPTYYDFHSGSSHQMFDPSYAPSVNLVRLNKTAVAVTADRPTTLQVVTIGTSSSLHASEFSQDRIYARSWYGDMAMILIYDTLLTTQQISDTEDAIKDYLGI